MLDMTNPCFVQYAQKRKIFHNQKKTGNNQKKFFNKKNMIQYIKIIVIYQGGVLS